MSSPGKPPRPRPAERQLLEAVAQHLAELGYRTYVDPDGTDYFDLAVRRGAEVGLVEGKVGRPSAVLGQALRRRPWADWVAVVLPSDRSAERLVARTAARRASFVGVFAYEAGRLREVRPPGSTHPSGEDDPFAATRALFRGLLEGLDDGSIPAGARWSGVGRAVLRASGGRRFAEWRLDEPPGPSG